MNVAFLCLGGNLGNRLQNIRNSVKKIEQLCGPVIKASQVYETDAWGSSSQKKYLNQVIKIHTALTAEDLLKKLLSIEEAAGRQRSGQRYNDRTVDLDILFYNNAVIHKKNLQVPHPRLHLRKFVLAPLFDIEKKLLHPILKKTVATLLADCDDLLHVSVYNEPQPLKYICIEGNIGSGKSTLAQALALKWKAAYLPETFADNPLLPLFYEEPAAYAFPLEYSFLISRFKQITNAVTAGNNTNVVSDFNFLKCLWFAKINLPEKEYRLFKKHFKTLAAQLPQPGLVIYLDTTIASLQQNIKKRGRPYEQQIEKSYLQAIERSYKKNIGKAGLKTLTIRVKTYHPGLEAELMQAIENYMKENFARQSKKHTFSLLK